MKAKIVKLEVINTVILLIKTKNTHNQVISHSNT